MDGEIVPERVQEILDVALGTGSIPDDMFDDFTGVGRRDDTGRLRTYLRVLAVGPSSYSPGMATTDVVPTDPASDPIPWTDVLSAWSALGAAIFGGLTLLVALIAAYYAKGQLDGLRRSLTVASGQLTVASDQLEEARTLRREQAQPYVVMSAVPNQAMPEFIEVVIQNLGTTGARDVIISCTPPLVRTDQEDRAQEVKLPGTIPFLAPGQEWRTFWDQGRERSEERYDHLPTRHDVSITYTDSFDEVHTTPSVLDWGVFTSRQWMVEKGVHQAVGHLEKISKDLHKLAVPQQMTKVAVYDGPQVDQKRADAYADRLRRHEELTARLLPTAVNQPAEQGDERSDAEPTP
ncbi:hypothetical protein O2W18_20830 [Modestobacter sp. VKM Ac-2983]|uniref:hypothetical protein n=1 Tax=Modestobacter sp. VKM Ac-2983 TaxID=3004137 RepID=UPI0022ABAD15|nr:hypothetical protein [Modestobacter sp. VKM Ac-2983]MCZ2807558.1 hypothetical protein [Modestobacter sp. VKM Ac-2983]